MPQPPYPPPQPQHNPGMSFLGFTGGALALLIIGLILIPVLLFIVCCGAGVLGVVTTPEPSFTPTPLTSQP